MSGVEILLGHRRLHPGLDDPLHHDADSLPAERTGDALPEHGPAAHGVIRYGVVVIQEFNLIGVAGIVDPSDRPAVSPRRLDFAGGLADAAFTTPRVETVVPL